jgi:hypothetical protein
MRERIEVVEDILESEITRAIDDVMISLISPAEECSQDSSGSRLRWAYSQRNLTFPAK